MLVLTRKVGERIRIGDDIFVTVVRIAQNGVRIGIEAPPHYAIVRKELEHSGEVEAAAELASSRAKPH